MSLLQQRISALSQPGTEPLLTDIVRGIEKESLRVNPTGGLAQTPHPRQLGSALTHPNITTDYSEALLEFITPPATSVEEVLKTLEDIHRFTYQQINDELLWVNSMPCQLGTDSDIPVARYGNSNIGNMKTIYRLGLGHRYGRLMQTIAGIHYNFSLPEPFWKWLQQREAPNSNLQDFTTSRYFGLIRNFRRYFPALLYLFGAAPAVCRSFVKGREHKLQPFGDDNHSLHLPYATSLRMGDLGYQSKAQASLRVCYNELSTYIETLHSALTESYPAYQQVGIKDASGNYQQLSTHLLQIENEFYSTIRPKRNAESGETPLGALKSRGVEYIEVRCLDLNPFHPVGIDAQQIHFLDTFLVYCLLHDSPESHPDEYADILENQHRVVNSGRNPELTLLEHGEEKPARELLIQLFADLASVAKLLDDQQKTQVHTSALETYRNRVEQPELCPSAQLLETMKTTGKSYFRMAMDQAVEHREFFLDSPLAPEMAERYQQLAADSLAKQRVIEAQDTLHFDEFLANYYRQYDELL